MELGGWGWVADATAAPRLVPDGTSQAPDGTSQAPNSM